MMFLRRDFTGKPVDYRTWNKRISNTEHGTRNDEVRADFNIRHSLFRVQYST
jgi:hypothetical protein